MPYGVQPLAPQAQAEPVKKITKKSAALKEYTPKENADLMHKLGGGVMSGLHVVGSILNTPSRLLWGAVNAAQGHEDGMGNLNPIDSTGGIELSHVLANNGVISHNNPNQWEILPTTNEDGTFNPGDIGRGLIDMVGDPLSWATPFGLTKAGQASHVGKAGAAPMAKGLINQLAEGQRGLVGFQLPLETASRGAIGGELGAKALSAADSALASHGIPSITQAVAETPLVRNIRATRNYIFQGKTHPLLHNLMPDYTDRLEKLNQGVDEGVTRWARDAELANQLSPAHRMEVRDWLEGVHPEQLAAAAQGRNAVLPAHLNPHTISEMALDNASRLHEGKLSSTGPIQELNDVVPLVRNNGGKWEAVRDSGGKVVLRDLIHAPRRLSQGVVEGQSLGSKALQVKTPDVVGREQVWKGNGLGTNGTNQLTKDQNIWREIHSVDKSQHAVTGEWLPDATKIAKIKADLDSANLAKGLGPSTEGQLNRAIWRKKVLAGEGAIQKHWGEIVMPKWQTRTHKQEVASAAGDLFDKQTRLGRHQAALASATDPIKIKRYTNLINKLQKKLIPQAERRLARAKAAGVNRYREISKKLVSTPEMEQHGIFGNDVLYDWRQASRAHARRIAAAPTVYEAIHRGINDAAATDKTVNVDKFLKAAGFHMHDDSAREHTANLISAFGGGTKDWRQVLDSHISKSLAEQLQSLTPNYKAPDAETWLSKGVRQVGAAYKANVLAMPSSRIRDVTTAALDATLRGHTTPYSHADALSIMRGDVLSPERAAIYSQEPRIAEWLSNRSLTDTPEHTTEALRQLLGTAFEHGLVKDIAPGQLGANIGDMLTHVPGRERRTSGQAARHFANTMLGIDRPDPKWHDWLNPFPENVFGATHTRNPLLAASNEFAGAGDTMNRYAATLGQMEQGHGFDHAVKATKSSQVDYNPETFSPAETWLRRYIFPFMSYYSRKSADVASELVQHPGGRTAQVIKLVAKAHQSDPSVPDSIASSLSIPLGEGPDGSKKYLTGFGMMHEQPVNMVGKFLGGDLSGGSRELLGMTYPWIHSPVEIGTGTHLYTGEKLNQLDPPVGRVLSNIGVATGLRSDKDGPVEFPGSREIEYALGKLPVSRSIGVLRTVTDTRPDRSAPERAMQLLSGVKTDVVSPSRQQKVLRKRMQDVAQGLGAKEINDIYFTPQQMARMKTENPRLAADIEQLRAGINAINRKSRITKNEKEKSRGQ